MGEEERTVTGRRSDMMEGRYWLGEKEVESRRPAPMRTSSASSSSSSSSE